MTMEQSDIVSTSRIERLIDLACAYNVPLLITVESRDTLYRYKSRMLEMQKGAGTASLIIDIPITDGPAVALKPGLIMNVYFALDEKRYLFESAVLRKTTFTLENKRKTSALEISYPNILRSGQRRQYFRVPVPLGRPISVECGVMGNRTDWLTQEPGAWNFPSRLRFEGRIINISVGGMLLAMKRAHGVTARVGVRLGMRFALAPNETPIALKGIIRRIEEGPTAEEIRVGVEFIDTNEKFDYRLAINRLYRYVAETRRETIQSGPK
ncbi:MAG: hypothetical protein Kow0099_03630 [Candidatus Abyssubacteria bacterium]